MLTTGTLEQSSAMSGDRSAMDRPLCYHCGTRCLDDAIAIEDKFFCCNGCKVVFQILDEHQMRRFYDLDTQPGVRVTDPKAVANFAYLDNEAVRERLLQFTDGKTAKVTFHIPAIHCVACVWLLENLFRINNAVGHAEVNFPRKEVSITFNEQSCPLSKLVGLLASLGYEPVLNMGSLDEKGADHSLRKLYLQMGVAGFAFGNIMLLSISQYLGLDSDSQTTFSPLFGVLSLILALPVILYSAADYWKAAWLCLRKRIVTIDVPIALGIAALTMQSFYDIATRAGEGYLDSLAGLVFFLLIGKWFQRKTYDRLSFDRDYKSYFPLSVSRKSADGEAVVPITTLTVGDHIVVRNQELIPADARLVQGAAHIDYSFVTGEYEPLEKEVGEALFAGGRQMGSPIEVEITKAVSQSYLTSLWNNEAFHDEQDAQVLDITNRVSKYFTLVVIALASAAGLYWWIHDPSKAVRAFSATLIVACPCALALSAPFTLGAALRFLGRHGFYVRSANIVEQLARIKTVIFDKTGTLTHSASSSVRFEGEPLLAEERDAITSLARHSAHPLSQSIATMLGGRADLAVASFEEIAGSGIEGVVRARHIRLGSGAWFASLGLQVPPTEARGKAVVYVAIHDEVRGLFVLHQAYRTETREMVDALQPHYQLAVLTGDHDRHRETLRDLFGEDTPLYFNQQPVDKLAFVRRMQEQGGHVMMVGDGLNDAGALKQSNVGMAVAEDVTAFSPSCDAIVDADQVTQLARVLSFARGAITVIVASFILSFAYNIVGVTFAARGALSPMVSAILMPLSSVSVVVFALAATRWQAKKRGLA